LEAVLLKRYGKEHVKMDVYKKHSNIVYCSTFAAMHSSLLEDGIQITLRKLNIGRL